VYICYVIGCFTYLFIGIAGCLAISGRFSRDEINNDKDLNLLAGTIIDFFVFPAV
jgi:hypothetical protein